MRVHKNVRPERVCKAGTVDEASYPKLIVSGEKASIVATDGASVVRIPCKPESGDVSGLIPHDALRAARRTTPKDEETANCMQMDCQERVHVATAGQYHDRPQVTGDLFSAFELAIPAANRKGAVAVSFDASLLMHIANAMATKRVTLSFVPGADPDDSVIRIDPAGECWAPGAVGAMMPESNLGGDDNE